MIKILIGILLAIKINVIIAIVAIELALILFIFGVSFGWIKFICISFFVVLLTISIFIMHSENIQNEIES